MFTGFASENTPAIQVWDFSTADKSLISISLTDDCAPIQVIVGGGSTNTINLYLPTSPIEGKQIKLVNTFYGNFAAPINIRSSDSSGSGSSTTVAQLNAGQTLDLCYSKNFISRSVSNTKTGWISLNQAPISASNPNAVSFGSGNIASGSASGTFGGSGNTASSIYSAVVGGNNNTASNTNAVVVGGNASTASGQGAIVLGGISNFANATQSMVAGGAYGNARSIVGNFVVPASSFPISGFNGRQQLCTLLLGRETIDATATRLTSNTSAAATTNQVILPDNSAYTFQGTCIANVTGGGNTSGWKFEGVIKRGANAASTALVAAVTPTVIAQDVGAVTWVLAITADTTNGGIAVTVTGQAATTIRWVAKIETTEVTF